MYVCAVHRDEYKTCTSVDNCIFIDKNEKMARRSNTPPHVVYGVPQDSSLIFWASIRKPEEFFGNFATFASKTRINQKLVAIKRDVFWCVACVAYFHYFPYFSTVNLLLHAHYVPGNGVLQKRIALSGMNYMLEITVISLLFKARTDTHRYISMEATRANIHTNVN